MYCPQCGQLQATSEVRFCSRCGFPLGVIAEVLAQGGVMATRGAESRERKISPRQKGVRQGTMLMLSTMLVVPFIVFVILLFHIHALIPLIPLSAVVCAVGGLLRIVYALMFEEAVPATEPDALSHAAPFAPAPLDTHMRGAAALPPAQGTPVTDWQRRPETAEIIQPPSVTENTTRLLDSKEGKARRKDEG